MEMAGKEHLARIFQPTGWVEPDDGTLLVQRHAIAADWTRVRNEWLLIRDRQVERCSFEHIIYSARGFKDRLAAADFTAIRCFGSLAGEPYGPATTRLVAVARRPAAAG